MIWANDAAAQALDWETAAAALDLPESGTISASFLGAVVVELTGRTGESPWFDFLNQLRRVVPAVRHQTYLLADGTYCRTEAELTATQSGQEAYDLVLKWRQWSYYKLLYKEMD